MPLPGSVAGARVTRDKSTPTCHLPAPLGSFLYGTRGRFWHLSFVGYRPPLSPDRVTTHSCREPTHKFRIFGRCTHVNGANAAQCRAPSTVV